MIPNRKISWLKGALRDFAAFPAEAKYEVAQALSMAARGEKSDSAKPMKGLGVFEIALRHRGDAFRVVYDVGIGDALWVIQAFQKKSKSGTKTPRPEIDLIRQRLKRLKEALQ